MKKTYLLFNGIVFLFPCTDIKTTSFSCWFRFRLQNSTNFAASLASYTSKYKMRYRLIHTLFVNKTGTSFESILQVSAARRGLAVEFHVPYLRVRLFGIIFRNTNTWTTLGRVVRLAAILIPDKFECSYFYFASNIRSIKIIRNSDVTALI